ncbi:hypothetical protein AgCh_005429 [Apium graveolens]
MNRTKVLIRKRLGDVPQFSRSIDAAVAEVSSFLCSIVLATMKSILSFQPGLAYMGLFETDVVPDANSIANSISWSCDNPERSLENTSSNLLTTDLLVFSSSSSELAALIEGA